MVPENLPGMIYTIKMKTTIQDWIRSLPKAELHVHLEGAISPEVLVAFAKKYALDLPKNSDALKECFKFTDFDHFLRVYLMISTCLRTKEDCRLMAKAHLKKAASQGILYSEVEWTPNTLLKNGISYRDQVDGLIEGIHAGEEEYQVTMRLIPDVIPGEGILAAMRLLDEIEANPREEVIAFSIGGPEEDYLKESFASVYQRARDLGLRTTAHAGETSGPEAVWESIRNLKVDRIIHGVHSPQDPKLMGYLKEHQIPIDICPTSNLKLGYFSSYKEHPIRLFIDEGIPVTLNSDDPALMEHDLVEEYQVLYEEGILSKGELKNLAAESFKQAFISEDRKKEYLSKLEE